MSSFIFILLSLFFTKNIRPQEYINKAYIENFLKAEYLLEKDDYINALEIYKSLLSYDSLNANILFKIGFCYLNLNSPKDKCKSLYYLSKAINNVNINSDVSNPYENSAPIECFYYLAKSHHLCGNPFEALKIIDSLSFLINQYDIKFNEDIKTLRSYLENYIKQLNNPLQVIFTNLGDSINSDYDDHSPVVSADGKLLIFTSKRPNEYNIKTEDNQYFEDIYISFKINNKWTKAKPIKEINTPKHDASIGLSPDGQYLFIYRDDSNIFYPQDGNIYYSKATEVGWSLPIKLTINTKYNENHASLSADGNELYFSSNKPGGYGGMDIYVSKKLPNGEWGLPINLGPSINTDKDEICPFIHPDGSTLFFSSNSNSSIGGFDIFFSEKNENNEWSEPTNLGYPINSPFDDVFFILTPDGKHAFYATEREDSRGRTDIYYITFPEKEEKKLAVISGTVNYPKNIPLDIKITVQDPLTNKIIGEYKPHPLTGRYILILKANNNYIVKFESSLFLPHIEYIEIPDTFSYSYIEKPVQLQPIVIDKIEKNYTFKFLPNSTTISHDDILKLEKISKILEYFPEFKLNINYSENSLPSVNELRESLFIDFFSERGIKSNRINAKNDQLENNLIQIYVEANDTLPKIKTLFSTEEIENKLNIKFKTTDNKLIIYPIYFSFNQYVGDFNIQNLINLSNWMKLNPKAQIEIIGHTDNIGNSEYNFKLGKKRAEFVKEQLVQLGINPKRLKVSSMGMKQPVADNNTPEGRQLNRRVEFKLINYKASDIVFKNKIELNTD